MTDEQTGKIIGQLSEWACCKLVLPRRLVRLFVPPKMTEAEALTAISCMAVHALREAKNGDAENN